MPWHCSKSDPRKVYDSRHETVCVAQTPDQAALIVRGVNALPGSALDTFVKLREPDSRGKESAEDSQSGAASGTGQPERPTLTHVTSHAEGCCAKHIAKASLSGALDQMQPWECPKCGTTYYALANPDAPGVIEWRARAAVMVFKP